MLYIFIFWLDEMEKKLKYGTLLQVYGKLLTQRQRDILTMYYDEDFSLTEISENLNISRQAVLDALHNGNSLLEEYERVLNVVEKNKEIKLNVEKLIDLYNSNQFSELGKELELFSESL